MSIVENRVVCTWHDGPIASGVITGKLHEELCGFEVDHIIRFPEASPGSGERMCQELLPKIITKYQLKWILVKIHDEYKPESLRMMAQRFGFTFQERSGEVEFWRKDCL